MLAAAGQCRDALSAVEAAAVVPTLIGNTYRGVNTDIEAVKHTVQAAESIAPYLFENTHNKGPPPGPHFTCLLVPLK